jgi:putative spermidine/putrescine transport system permease protein
VARPLSVPGTRTTEATFRRLARRAHARQLLLVSPAVVAVSVVVVFPLVRVVALSFWDPELTLRHYVAAFQDPVFYRVLGKTLEVGVLTTLGCLILGYPVAHLMATAPPGMANALLAIVLLAFWTSLLVRTYAWMVLLGRRGVINNLLVAVGAIEQPLPLMYNLFGLQLGMMHVLLPLMILPLYSVMQGIDHNLVRAAQNLGAGPVRAFLRVFLPLSLPGVAAGSLLVFMVSIGYFITPALLGGRTDMMLGQLIELQIAELLNWRYGATLVTILLGLVLALFVGYQRLVGAGLRWGERSL